MTRTAQSARVMAAVLADMAAWRGQHNHGDGKTALEHARAHRAAMSAEKRAELDKEWDA
jgi:hypothetical protein